MTWTTLNINQNNSSHLLPRFEREFSPKSVAGARQALQQQEVADRLNGLLDCYEDVAQAALRLDNHSQDLNCAPNSVAVVGLEHSLKFIDPAVGIDAAVIYQPDSKSSPLETLELRTQAVGQHDLGLCEFHRINDQDWNLVLYSPQQACHLQVTSKAGQAQVQEVQI